MANALVGPRYDRATGGGGPGRAAATTATGRRTTLPARFRNFDMTAPTAGAGRGQQRRPAAARGAPAAARRTTAATGGPRGLGGATPLAPRPKNLARLFPAAAAGPRKTAPGATGARLPAAQAPRAQNLAKRWAQPGPRKTAPGVTGARAPVGLGSARPLGPRPQNLAKLWAQPGPRKTAPGATGARAPVGLGSARPLGPRPQNLAKLWGTTPSTPRAPPPPPRRYTNKQESNALWNVEGGVPLFALLNTKRVGNLENPEDPRRYTVEKYKLFNEDGRLQIVDPRNANKYQWSNKETQNMVRPPICLGETMNLRDMNPATSCFLRGMTERVTPVLKKMDADRTAGVDACVATGGKKLQPHQRGIYEVARAMAQRTPEQLGGSRGLLVFHNTGSGKCTSVDTLVMCESGAFVRAGDLAPGMRLMGPDGTPRTVLDVGRGTEMMYEICPTKGDKWRCNASHILSLKYNRQGKITKTREGYWCVHWHEVMGDKGAFRTRTFVKREDAEALAATIDPEHVVDIPLREYLRLPIYMRHYLKLFRAGRIESFGPRPEPLVDPYALGAWLGDGHANGPMVTLGDPEIADEIARRTGLPVEANPCTEMKTAPTYRIKCPESEGSGRRSNPFMAALRAYELLHDKHIPEDVKCGSVDTRLAVLAGLLDTDGYLGGNCYELTQKSERLARDAAFVARSLGFAAYLKPVRKACTHDGKRVENTYHKLSISGAGLDDLPMVVARKRAAPRAQVKDARRTGFDVRPVGLGEYAGPVLDGDHRYLLWDFTVTHNTVTSLAIMMAFWFAQPKRRIILATTVQNEADNNLHKYAENMISLFPNEARQIFGSLPPKGCEKAWANNPAYIAPLTERVRTYSFTKLASALGAKGRSFGRANPEGDGLLLGSRGYKGSVLIMDEVQSLFTPDPKYQEATDYLVGKQKRLLDPKFAPHMYIFALTATPGNTVADMIDVLNFVRPLGAAPFTPADARDPAKFAGLVSYVDIRSDTTRYGAKKIQNIYVPMDPKYYAGFLKSITLANEDLDYERAVKQKKEFAYLLKQRTAGDFLIKTATTGVYSAAELAGMAKERIPRVVKINSSQERVLSPKLVQVLTNVLKMPGKQYIWVAELNTAKVVAAALKALGYGQVEPKSFSKKSGGGGGRNAAQQPACPPPPGRVAAGKRNAAPAAATPGKPTAVLAPGPSLASPGNRFILYKKGTADGEDLDDRILKAYADFFNAPANRDGSRCKVMLATETFYQGLDMSALQGVHLVDSLFNATADKQAVGRALRLCGHSGAPAKTVVVHRYFSVPPPKFDAEAFGNVKGAAAKKKLKDLGPLDKRVRQLVGPDATKVIMPEGTNARDMVRYGGVNAYVHTGGAARQQAVTQFELGLKAYAIDCPLFKPYYHRNEPFQCGARPSASNAAAVSRANSLPSVLAAAGPPGPSRPPNAQQHQSLGRMLLRLMGSQPSTPTASRGTPAASRGSTQFFTPAASTASSRASTPTPRDRSPTPMSSRRTVFKVPARQQAATPAGKTKAPARQPWSAPKPLGKTKLPVRQQAPAAPKPLGKTKLPVRQQAPAAPQPAGKTKLPVRQQAPAAPQPAGKTKLPVRQQAPKGTTKAPARPQALRAGAPRAFKLAPRAVGTFKFAPGAAAPKPVFPRKT